MKKTNLVYFIGIGLLMFLPFMRVAVAAPPCWNGLGVDETYVFDFTLDLTNRDGQYTTDDVNLLIYTFMDAAWMGFIDDGEMGAIMQNASFSHEVTALGDLGPDIEYLSGYQASMFTHWMVFNSSYVNVAWALDKDSPHVYEGIILENSTEYALWHNSLKYFFDIYSWTTTSIAVSTEIDWTEVVTTANLGLTTATATVVTDGDDEVGFKLTVAVDAWATNTLALELEVIFDDCGLLEMWEMSYGGDSILMMEQSAGTTCTPCPTGGDAIPGFELPILIGVASIISLVLIKKIKKK